jgi:spermidine synthase
MCRRWALLPPMSQFFKELAYCETPMGALTLRRKEILELDGLEVFEVTLGDEFLMSSLFNDAEIALSKLGLAAVDGDGLDVVVGGLGLGYTAVAALEEERVGSLVVIDTLQEVIDWHQQGMVPMGEKLTGDPRCELVCGDFFAGVSSGDRALDPGQPGKLWDAVLLDVDHTPEALLHERHGGFYKADGLAKMAAHIKPGGVFAMWSDGLPLAEFVAALESAFTDVQAEIVAFENPLQQKISESTVYIARRAQA